MSRIYYYDGHSAIINSITKGKTNKDGSLAEFW
jgi:hypothetical protein